MKHSISRQFFRNSLFACALKALAIVGALSFASVGSAQTSPFQVAPGVFKITSIEKNWFGDLLIYLNQSVTFPGGTCGITNLVIVPKYVPATGWSVPESNSAGLQALALAAMARNADVQLTVDNSAGCVWGSYPALMAIRLF
jgi:hypothetical protein